MMTPMFILTGANGMTDGSKQGFEDAAHARGSVILPKSPPNFQFGGISRAKLAQVHPRLQMMANIAISNSLQDFGITCGARTIQEQEASVARGTSKTMDSKHLIQKDGYSHAIDATPFVDGKPVWDWSLVYMVVMAMDNAATRLGIAQHIRWGGAWDRRLSDFGGSPKDYADACRAYTVRHPGKDFLDGPHYEWQD